MDHCGGLVVLSAIMHIIRNITVSGVVLMMVGVVITTVTLIVFYFNDQGKQLNIQLSILPNAEPLVYYSVF